MMKKIYFDEQGNIGTVVGTSVLPLRPNEKLVCTEQEAVALGLASGQWLTLDALRELPNAYAETAYKIFTGTLNE